MRTGDVPSEQIDPRLRDMGDFVDTAKKYIPNIAVSCVGIPGTIALVNRLREEIAKQNWGLAGDILKALTTGSTAVLGVIGLDASADMNEFAHPYRKGILFTESIIATGVGIVGTIDEVFDTKFLPGWGGPGSSPRNPPCPGQTSQRGPQTWQPRTPDNTAPPAVAQRLST